MSENNPNRFFKSAGMTSLFKRFYQNLRFKLSSNNSILFTGFYRYLYSPQRGSLSYLLNEYSRKKKKQITVIQVGANDGITHDPIHKFIKRDKWKGLLLEPQKHIFPRLSRLYKKNKGIKTINAAVGYEDGTTLLYKIGFSNSRWATGLATFNKDVLLDAFESGYVKRNADKENIEIPENKEEQIVAEEVEVISPDTLLKKHEINKIDLLQIDTEGYDFEIIKMFLMTPVKPGMIVFEHTHLSDNDLIECEKLLDSKGYDIKRYGRNTAAILINDNPK